MRPLWLAIWVQASAAMIAANKRYLEQVAGLPYQKQFE